MKDNKKTVGRPIEKENRVKIGLSIDGETNELLARLAANSGKTKSKVFEDAIKLLESREELIQSRIRAFEELGDDALLDFDELMKNRKASFVEQKAFKSKEEERENVG